MHKWSLINKALEMGIPEPMETYSSSPHLFTDLDIPAGSKGRLRASTAVPKTVESAGRPPRERRDGDSSSRPPRERREGDRTRTRTHGASSSASAESTPVATGTEAHEQKLEGAGTHDGAAPTRRRNRRRRPSGGAPTPPPAA